VNIITGPPDDEPYSDQIECARCGEQFYYELHECPNCGARVYSGFDEEEDEYKIAVDEPGGAQSRLVEMAAILSGWFIAALFVVALFLPLRNAFAIPPESLFEKVLLFGVAGVAGFIAGWMVVRTAGSRWKLHGVLAAIGSFGAAFVLFWLLYSSLQPLLRSPAAWIGAPLVLLLSLFGAGLAERMFRTAAADSLFGRALQERLLYDRLLAITRNDRATVERLVAYEKQRLPRASRFELMQRAIERWERDNR
jgi:hypothetical protein